MKLLLTDEKGPIKIYENNNEPVINGRELHKGLESKQDFTTWIKARLNECDAVENIDYTTFHNFVERENSNLKAKRTEYVLKMEIAKEMAMMERNEQGKKYRRYFIEVEKRFKQNQLDTSNLSPELQMFNNLFNALARQEMQMKQITDTAEQALTTVASIQDVMVQKMDDWRDEVNRLFNKVQKASNIPHQELRSETYVVLEKKAGCDLATRVRNLKKRLTEEGATKTKVNSVTKIDVIETDKKLKEIYSQIIKEYAIKYSA